MENKKKPRCYNCKHASDSFKIVKLTHYHCLNPKFKQIHTSPWDSLRVFSENCNEHEFKNN